MQREESMMDRAEMIRPSVIDYGQRVAEYNTKAEAAGAETEGKSKFKEWRAGFSADIVAPDLNVPDLSALTVPELLSMLNKLDTLKESVNLMIQTQYFAQLPVKVRIDDGEDLEDTHSELKEEYKVFKQMVESGWIEQSLLDEYLPIKMKKVGRALEPAPTLTLLKPPASPQLRSNSKRMKLYVDGVMVKEDNFTQAILTGLGMDYQTFRDLAGGVYEPDRKFPVEITEDTDDGPVKRMVEVEIKIHPAIS